MSRQWALIISALMSFSVFATQPLTQVYLGVVDAGPGSAFMGHAFISFGQDAWDLEQSISYEFSPDFEQLPLELQDESKLWGLEFIKLAKKIHELPLIVKSRSTIELIQTFQRVDRGVKLYKLKLTSDEAILLREELEYSLLESALGAYNQPDQFDQIYHGFKNNCATILLRKISNTLDADRSRAAKLETLWDEWGDFRWKQLFSSSALTGAFPIAWDGIIRRSPLYHSSVEFRSHRYMEMLGKQRFSELFRNILERCGRGASWNPFQRALLNRKGVEGLLDQLSEELRMCERFSAPGNYQELISLVINLTNSPQIFKELLR